MTQNTPQPAANLIVLDFDDESDSKEGQDHDEDDVVFLSETPAIIDSSDEDDIIFLSKVGPAQPLDLSSDCVLSPDRDKKTDVKPIVIAPLPDLDDDNNSNKDDPLDLGLNNSEDKALLKDLDSLDLHNQSSKSSDTNSLPPAKLPDLAPKTYPANIDSPVMCGDSTDDDQPDPSKSSGCDNSAMSNLDGQNGDQNMCQIACPSAGPSCGPRPDLLSHTSDTSSVNSNPVKSDSITSFTSMLDNMQNSLLDDLNSFTPAVSTSKSDQNTLSNLSVDFPDPSVSTHNLPAHASVDVNASTAPTDTSASPPTDTKKSFLIRNLLDDLGSKLPVNQPVAMYGNMLLPLSVPTSSFDKMTQLSVDTSVNDAKSVDASGAKNTTVNVTPASDTLLMVPFDIGSSNQLGSTSQTPLTNSTASSSANSYVSSANDSQFSFDLVYGTSSSVQVKPLMVPSITNTSQVAPSWVNSSSTTLAVPSTSQDNSTGLSAVKPSVPVSLVLPPGDNFGFLKNKPTPAADIQTNNTSSSPVGQEQSTGTLKRSNSATKAVNRVVPFKKRCLSSGGETTVPKFRTGGNSAWDSNWCSRCKFLVAYENLSRCTQGHACCGTCLQQLAKAILSKGKKASLQCTYPECDSYFSISELERTLPKMVVDILEEKLDQEYVDVASDLTWRHLVDGEDLMDLGADTVDDDETVERPLRLERSNSLPHHLPPNWDSMGETAGFKLVDLEGGSEEYQNCAFKFYHTMVFPRADIQRIQRVQNPILWQFYAVKKTQMECENNGTPSAEISLFHGTSRHVVEAICKNGFDWRLCGTHGTMYGQGSYFARDASYSHTYTDKPPNLLYSTLTARRQAALAAQGLYQMRHHYQGSGPMGAAYKLQRRIKQYTNLLRQQQQQTLQPSSNFIVMPSGSSVPAPPPAPPPAHQNLVVPGPPGPAPPTPVTIFSAGTSVSQKGAQPLPAHSSKSRGGQASKLNYTTLTSQFLQVPVQQPAEQPGTPPEKHTHVMFLARVLVGRSAQGKSNMRKPPPLDPTDPYGLSFDSCTDNVNDPKIYVIFDSAQCYPEYIIEYTNDLTCNQL